MASLEITAIANISFVTSLDLPPHLKDTRVIVLFISYILYVLGWEEVSLQPVAKFQQAR